jgi:hypothetical protein
MILSLRPFPAGVGGVFRSRWALALALAATLTRLVPLGAQTPTDSAAWLAQRAAELHQARRVGEAGRLYRALLEVEPAADPTPEERARVLALAPLLYLHGEEPFVLEDVVAVVHPEEPLVAYHLFWDDDIDFPDDQEPTDHEVVWVEHDAAGRARAVVTYFHGERVRQELTPDGPGTGDGEPRRPEHAAGGPVRPRVAVEWGKHGSLPLERVVELAEGGTEAAPEPRWAVELRGNWRRLHEEGTRRPDHRLARGWPTSFPGRWASYLHLPVESDPRRLLEERGMIARTRWANAVLDQWFLPYNFSAKPGWP